mgnify:CR=1 FL=1
MRPPWSCWTTPTRSGRPREVAAVLALRLPNGSGGSPSPAVVLHATTKSPLASQATRAPPTATMRDLAPGWVIAILARNLAVVVAW